MPQIKLSLTKMGSEDQTPSKRCYSSCNNLGARIREAYACQGSPKHVLMDSGLDIDLAIPFDQAVTFKIILNKQSSVRSRIIIN